MTASHAHSSRAASRRHASANGLHQGFTAIGDVVRTEVRREMRHLKERAGELVEQGKSKARAVKESAAERVSEHPLSSVLVAAGVGLLIGLMFGRRR